MFPLFPFARLCYTWNRCFFSSWDNTDATNLRCSRSHLASRHSCCGILLLHYSGLLRARRFCSFLLQADSPHIPELDEDPDAVREAFEELLARSESEAIKTQQMKNNYLRLSGEWHYDPIKEGMGRDALHVHVPVTIESKAEYTCNWYSASLEQEL